MKTTERILEYKRLAGVLRDSPTKEVAVALAQMCDEDARLSADRNRRGFSFLEEQAAQFILAIGRKARPSARDRGEKLSSKAGDILMEVAEFERIPVGPSVARN